ncbi:substrate-binding domain-containing protein [Clostridium swellfunianum]|uniref:substrate-binding domain-containing protein n=1 Tax=Clostridium swellfunianum TaxID=1367462 RepID=UPI003D7C1871
MKVPENLSIVSFDDSQLALASEIKLTTVAHPKEFLGIEAGKAMLPIIERRQKFNNLKMEPKLIIRNSIQRMLR